MIILLFCWILMSMCWHSYNIDHEDEWKLLVYFQVQHFPTSTHHIIKANFTHWHAHTLITFQLAHTIYLKQILLTGMCTHWLYIYIYICHFHHHASLLNSSIKQVNCVRGMAGIEPTPSKSNDRAPLSPCQLGQGGSICHFHLTHEQWHSINYFSVIVCL